MKEQKYEEILRELDEELENANYHDFVGVGFKLFEEIKPFVSKSNYENLARAIFGVINRKI